MSNTFQNPLINANLPALQGAPGGTPPMLPGGESSTPGSAQPDALHQMIQQVLKAGQQKTLPQPVPAPVPGQKSGEIPGYMQGQGWGFERFATQVGAQIQNGVAMHKQKQLAQAESDWNQLASAIQSGNQQALNAIINDPKKLKNMAKALNQDWLNPEKTTVYKQALENVLKQQQAKGQAAQGLMGVIKQLIGKATRPQPQLSDQQKQQMGQEIMQKAPITQGQTDSKSIANMMQSEAEVVNAQANLTRAQSEARQKYQVMVGGNGEVIAVDRTDPSKSVRVTTQDGKPLTGQVKGAASIGKVAVVAGVPYGITGIRDGKPVVKVPGDPDWTGQDAKVFAAAKAAQAASDATKDHRMMVSAQARASFYAKTREYGVIDTQTGGLVMLSPDAINQNPGRYAPASQAMQTMNRQSIFGEIDYTAGQLNQAIAALPDTGFDATSRAQISAVLRDVDPRSALSTFLGSSAAETLSDAQVQYITGLVSLQESAMSLRSLAGMGQGSDQLRSAIIKMLPGPTTPSRSYAQRQMQLFQGEVNQLRKSVPGLGKNPPPSQQGKDADPLGILQ
jgi:hypothetical protein